MSLLDVVKIIFIPALIAAGLYFSLAYAILPLIRKHRDRYSQYLPLDSISQRTTSLRDRMMDAIVRLIIYGPRRAIVNAEGEGNVRESSSGDDADFADEDVERLVGFNNVRRERGSGVA